MLIAYLKHIAREKQAINILLSNIKSLSISKNMLSLSSKNHIRQTLIFFCMYISWVALFHFLFFLFVEQLTYITVVMVIAYKVYGAGEQSSI